MTDKLKDKYDEIDEGILYSQDEENFEKISFVKKQKVTH